MTIVLSRSGEICRAHIAERPEMWATGRNAAHAIGVLLLAYERQLGVTFIVESQRAEATHAR